MTAHADASPSSASIWIACPASVTQARGKARVSSPYAREGTAAHEVAERIVHGLGVPSSIDVDGETVEIDNAMLEHVRVFTDYVDKLRRESSVFATETRISLPWLPEPIFGTADVLAEYEAFDGPVLEVVDLKYGRGVPVSPESPQLKIYALGSLMEASDEHLVKLTIVQPRLAGGSGISSVSLSGKDLWTWNDQVLVPAVQRIADGDPTENPGDHCRFCVRAGECRSLAAQAQSLAKAAFSAEPKAFVGALDDEELANALDVAEKISSWVSLVKLEAQSRIESGKTLPGWELASRRSLRAWASEDQARDALDRLGVPLWEVTQLGTPAAVERIMKTHNIDPRQIIPLIVKEPCKPSLSRIDGIALDAKSVFNALA